MAIPHFYEDEDKYEINLVEFLRMEKEHFKYPFQESLNFYGEALKWWRSLDEDNRLYSTWEKFEELFSNKWIKDTNMEAIYIIQDELKEEKENKSSRRRVRSYLRYDQLMNHSLRRLRS
jgi:hypothetical protein